MGVKAIAEIDILKQATSTGSNAMSAFLIIIKELPHTMLSSANMLYAFQSWEYVLLLIYICNLPQN